MVSRYRMGEDAENLADEQGLLTPIDIFVFLEWLKNLEEISNMAIM